MRKTIILSLIALFCVTTASAQYIERGLFNHVGANLSVGTQGIGIGLATPIYEYAELSADINFMPSIKIKGDVNVDFSGIPVTIADNKVKITGDLARTTSDVKLSIYPFGGNSSFFVAGGFSFGGYKIAELTGHSDGVAAAIAQNPAYKDQIVAEIDKYNVKFNDNGDVLGDVRVKKFRPYVGLGFGRLVPTNRVNFRFELGCQFMGKMEIYQSGNLVDTNDLNDTSDDISKVVDKLKVYPVVKFTLTTRIL
ncbi:MAG: hypothetical protein IJ527_00605 [Prevotella sp.]|nr:hypothetical protein [Prevotella sp.]